jgi:dihydropyrimidinase
VATVGSDHCCYDSSQKTKVDQDVRLMPNGLPGVETRLPVLQDAFVASGRMSWERFVEVSAANPARLNGIYGRKGTLLPGADADLALWDPAAVRTVRAADLHMATDYTPFEGRSITGWPTTVVVRGRVVVDDSRVVDATPLGRHLPAAPLRF